jgi:hypothetical protein
MALVGCAIFGCLTIPKYRLQVEDCFQTWCKDAIEAGWIVRFYTDIIPDDLDSALKEYCVNIEYGDSYMSATWKQWRGLEHISSSFPSCKYYFTAGTDSFLNVHACCKFLQSLDYSESLYIGHSPPCSEIAFGRRYQYYSGVAIFLSKSALEQVLDEIPNFIAQWIDAKDTLEIISVQNGVLNTKKLLGACDLQLGIICTYLPIKWCGNEQLKGLSHTTEGYDKDSIMSTHLMSHDDFWDYWSYLQSKKVA